MVPYGCGPRVEDDPRFVMDLQGLLLLSERQCMG